MFRGCNLLLRASKLDKELRRSWTHLPKEKVPNQLNGVSTHTGYDGCWTGKISIVGKIVSNWIDVLRLTSEIYSTSRYNEISCPLYKNGCRCDREHMAASMKQGTTGQYRRTGEKILIEGFGMHSKSGLYFSWYALLDHRVENIRKSGRNSIFDHNPYQHYNVHFL